MVLWLASKGKKPLILGKFTKVLLNEAISFGQSLIYFFMPEKYLMLNDIDAYKIAFRLSNFIWDIVIRWGHFERRTVGAQFVEAADSISANIAEGFGRYFKKDKIRFYHYSAGSTKECFDWNQKAWVRKLLSEAEYKFIFTELQKLPEAVNRLIKYTNLKLTR